MRLAGIPRNRHVAGRRSLAARPRLPHLRRDETTFAEGVGGQLQALIIIGHGSHLNAESSAPVYAHAAAIRATGA
ncbi:MAG TPA: hypothetical protein VFY65_10435, partial [Longimicrobium sp.]|nr:hypothetical protein [Longimicrobium sp.]